MPVPALTSRKRVNRLFARQDHDRIPRHVTYWDETIARWQAEGLRGGTGKVLELYVEAGFDCLQLLDQFGRYPA